MDTENNPQSLVFGDLASNKYGITFIASLSIPSGLDGTIEWVQNIKSDITMDTRSGVPDSWSTNNQWALDDEAVYPIMGAGIYRPVFQETLQCQRKILHIFLFMDVGRG